jgi:hypothetical protein
VLDPGDCLDADRCSRGVLPWRLRMRGC